MPQHYQISVTPKARARLRAEADRRGVSVARVTDELVNGWLDEHGAVAVDDRTADHLEDVGADAFINAALDQAGAP